MNYRLRYIEALYGFDPNIEHVAVGDSATARTTLEIMGAELSGTNGLIAIYVPEGTDEAYQPGNMRGRVVGAVRLLQMPEGRKVTDYFYRDVIDNSLRWPFGWPCEAVFGPPVEECPYLRSLVEMTFGARSFAPYVSRFQDGPFKLEPQMASAIMSYFERIGPL